MILNDFNSTIIIIIMGIIMNYHAPQGFRSPKKRPHHPAPCRLFTETGSFITAPGTIERSVPAENLPFVNFVNGRNRKPWVFTIKYRGLQVKLPHHAIL